MHTNIGVKLENTFEKCRQLNRGIGDDLYSQMSRIIETLKDLKSIGHSEFSTDEYKAIVGALSAMRNARTFCYGQQIDDAFVQVWAATELLHTALVSYQGIDPSEAPTLTLDYTDVRDIIARQSAWWELH